MVNISEAIRKASGVLKQSGIPDPLREAKSLLLLALQRDKAFLIAHPEYQLNESEGKVFEEFVERRSKREPFQHIAGRQEFWRLDFIVSPDVLIPRPETELIVEAGIKILEDIENPNFCEVGIGSGCIAISILHEIKTARAYGLDISEKAIAIAEKNARQHNVADRLSLKNSDVFQNLSRTDKFDLIVSNPPYVPNKDIPALQAEVRDFDPHIALTDGKDGLSIIRKIIIQSPHYLKPSGFMLLEFGFDQSHQVRRMFDPKIWPEVKCFPDLQGFPRMVKAQIN